MCFILFFFYLRFNNDVVSILIFCFLFSLTPVKEHAQTILTRGVHPLSLTPALKDKMCAAW